MRRIPRIVRYRLRPDQIWSLIAHRYGSTDRFDDGDILSYVQVSKVSGVAAASVRNHIVRFHRNGNKVICKPFTGRKQAVPDDV